MASPSEIPPDTLLAGKLRLIQRIGRGGMGDVWIARNEATHAEVAVKTLVRSERNEVHDERFRREARLAATISHRNVVRIFDLVDAPDGTLGLVMELLRGGTLEACMRDHGPLSTIHALAVTTPILSALNHVHEKGIVHRDVKPANIFFAVEPDGHVIPKILDFGIAKLPAATSALTLDGSVLGTPHYMSPEQIRGQTDLDGRSDMFSLAVLLYEMLTGVRVFQRDTAAASLAAVLEHEVDPDPRIEPRVWVALSRALAKRPYERFATCAEFVEALRNAVEATDEDFAAALQELRPQKGALLETEGTPRSGVLTGMGSSPSLRSRTTKRKRRSVLWTVGAAGIIAAVAVSATLAVTRSGTTQARADEAHPSSSPLLSSPTPPSSPAASVTTAPTMIELGDTPATTDVSAASTTALVPTPLAAPGIAASTRATGAPHATGKVLPPPTTTKVLPAPTKPVATSPGF